VAVIAQAEFDVTMSSEDREPNSHGTPPSGSSGPWPRIFRPTTGPPA
jgi:hypothetical protein